MQVTWTRLLVLIAIFAPCHGQRRIQDIIQSIKASGKTHSISPSFNGERKFEIIGTGGLPLQSEGNAATPEISSRRDFLHQTIDRAEGQQRSSTGPTIDDIITGSLSRFENDHQDNGKHKAESIPIEENESVFSLHKPDGLEEEEEEESLLGESSRHPNRPRRRRPPNQRRPQQGDRRQNIFQQENNGFRRPNGFQQGNNEIRRPSNFQQEGSDVRRPNNFQENNHIRGPNNFQQEINEIRRPNNFQQETNEIRRPQHRPRQRPNEKRPFRDTFNYVRAKRQPGSRFQGGPQRPNGPFRGNQNTRHHQQHPLKSPNLVGFKPPEEIYHGFEPYFKASTPFDEVEYPGHNEVTTPVTPESSLPEHYRPDNRPGPPRPKRERRPSLNNINNLNRHVGKPRRKRPNRKRPNNFEVENPRDHLEEDFGVSGPQGLHEFSNEGVGIPINNFESDNFGVPNPPPLGGFTEEVKPLSGFANEVKPLGGFANEIKPLSGFTNEVKPFQSGFQSEGLETPTRTEIRVPTKVREPVRSFSSEKKRPPGTRKPVPANQAFGLFPASGSPQGIENHDFKVAELSNPFEKEMNQPSQFNQHNNNQNPFVNNDRVSHHGEDKGFFSGVPENFPKLEDFGVSWESQKIRTKRSTRRKVNNPFYYSNRRRRGSRSGASRRRPTRPSHIAQDRGQTGPTGFWDDEDFDTDFFSGGGTPPYGTTPNNYSPYDFYDEYQPQPQPQPQPIASYGSRRRQSSRRQQKPRKPQYEYEYQPEPQYEPRPTPTFYGNTRKSSPYNYNEEDNEILGSGNFEVIKGGTFYDPHDYHSAYSQYPSNSNTRRPSQGQGFGYYNKGGGDYFHNFRDFADIKGDRGDLYYK